MNLTCGVRGEAESEDHEIFVCHHCGMPVCERHGLVVSTDEAFHDSPEAREDSDRATQNPGLRAAMHCPGCAEKYHRGARKRHGWVDPGRFGLALRTRRSESGNPVPRARRSDEPGYSEPDRSAQHAGPRDGTRYKPRIVPQPSNGSREPTRPQPDPQGQPQPKAGDQPSIEPDT